MMAQAMGFSAFEFIEATEAETQNVNVQF
jgi:hypothetical protein